MTHFLPETEKFKSPEYWGGYDIFDEGNFTDLPSGPFIHTNRRQYNFARNTLINAQTQILAGNSAEIRQQKSGEFDPTPQNLEDGTVVVIDNEGLSRHIYADPSRNWNPHDSWSRVTAPISRTFSEYWAANRYIPRDHDDQTDSSGYEELTYWEDNIKYSRLLSWGVIVSYEKQRRGIQPFAFTGDRYGNVHKYERNFPWNEHVLPFPVAIGEVKARSLPITMPRSDELSCVIDGLERIRAIDVVYPAAGRKKGKKSRIIHLGRKAVAKPIPSISSI
jgi:hypothetical protein